MREGDALWGGGNADYGGRSQALGWASSQVVIKFARAN